MSDNTIGQYLEEVGEFSLLSAEEEQGLARRSQKGDKVARNQLVEANLRVVVFLAKKFRSDEVSFADLIQIGNAALLKAAATYTPAYDSSRFSHVAAPRVFGEFLDTFRKLRRRRLPPQACDPVFEQWARRNGGNHRPQFENVILARIDKQRKDELERSEQRLERALVADIRARPGKQTFVFWRKNQGGTHK